MVFQRQNTQLFQGNIRTKEQDACRRYKMKNTGNMKKEQWMWKACVDEGKLTALILTASAVVRKPTKERLQALKKRVKGLGKIYSGGYLVAKLKELSQ